MCKLTDPEPSTLNTPSHSRKHHSSALIAPGSSSRTRDSPLCSGAVKLLELANPKPAYPALLFPMETAIKAPACAFSSLLLPFDDPRASPCGPALHDTLPVSRDL